MLTTEVLDQMASDDRWLGYGYLGARRNALDTSDPEAVVDPALVVEADRRVVESANEQHMTYEQLFRWANNKTGRWYGDTMFGGYPEQAHRHLPGTRLH
jgi:hypothetical protein